MRPPAVLRLIALTAIALRPAAAAASSRPGTPDQERAEILGPDKVRISWFDTATRHDGAFEVIFEVEAATKPQDPSSGYLVLQSYDPDQRNHWDVGGLQSGIHHCFRVWSRDPDSQLTSGVPSAWACADLPPPFFGKASPSPLYTTQPLAGRTNWIRLRSDRLTAQPDGFVTSVPAGRYCPNGWREVLAHNGGLAGLAQYGAYRSAGDQYWLCWSDHIHATETPPSRHLFITEQIGA